MNQQNVIEGIQEATALNQHTNDDIGHPDRVNHSNTSNQQNITINSGNPGQISYAPMVISKHFCIRLRKYIKINLQDYIKIINVIDKYIPGFSGRFNSTDQKSFKNILIAMLPYNNIILQCIYTDIIYYDMLLSLRQSEKEDKIRKRSKDFLPAINKGIETFSKCIGQARLAEHNLPFLPIVTNTSMTVPVGPTLLIPHRHPVPILNNFNIAATVGGQATSITGRRELFNLGEPLRNIPTQGQPTCVLPSRQCEVPNIAIDLGGNTRCDVFDEFLSKYPPIFYF